jgi:hypothetical protein
MKIKMLACALTLGIAASPALADRIGGAPRVDFSSGELVIPCVKVRNSRDNDSLEGRYFDVRMERRGNFFNYELTEAVAENLDVCRRIAALAAWEDDDFDDSDDRDDYGGFSRTNPDGDGKVTRLFVGCEIDDDDDDDDDDDRESKIEVKVKNLAPGNYRARVTSGGVSVVSLEKGASRSETEFKFKSETDDNDKTLIATDFIQDRVVTGEILDANGLVVLSANAICKIDD